MNITQAHFRAHKYPLPSTFVQLDLRAAQEAQGALGAPD
jgi:hypothetical protein